MGNWASLSCLVSPTSAEGALFLLNLCCVASVLLGAPSLPRAMGAFFGCQGGGRPPPSPPLDPRLIGTARHGIYRSAGRPVVGGNEYVVFFRMIGVR